MRADGDDLVRELVQLARTELTGDAPRTAVRVLPNLRPRAEPAPRRKLWALGAVTAVLACVIGFVLLGRAAPITYTVVDGAVVSGAVLGGEGTRLRFSEGSEVSLEPGAEATVAELSARGGTVRVRGGRARVAVAHRRGAEWTVEAGPYAVRVTGTEFDVRWSDADRTLEVTMRSGAVEVTRPSWKGPIRLRAGQRLRWMDGEPPRLVDAAAPPSEVALHHGPSRQSPEPDGRDDALSSSAAADPIAVPNAKGSARPEAQDLGANGGSWSRLVAQGKFDAVIADAERQNVERVLARASLEDLRALADAARYVRRTQLAERALLAQRKRFASSAAARDAAFLLGQVAEARGQRGLAWYEAYLREAPSGAYAPQALGRKMMIAYREGGARGAEAIAKDYLVRYRKGPYAAAARKIVSEAIAAP